jgi:curli biogenesis system outer membrane secretion channel CsgG
LEVLVKPDIPQIEDIDSIAIIEPSNLTDSPEISLTLHNFLVKYFLKTGRFKVLERSRMDPIIQEQKLGVAGLIDETQAAKIGALIGFPSRNSW